MSGTVSSSSSSYSTVFQYISGYFDSNTVSDISLSSFLSEEIDELKAANIFVIFDNQPGASTVSNTVLPSSIAAYPGQIGTYIRMNAAQYAPIPVPGAKDANGNPVGSTATNNVTFLTTLAHEAIHALEGSPNSLHTGTTLASVTSSALNVVKGAEWVKVNAESEGLATIGQAIVYKDLKPTLGAAPMPTVVQTALDNVIGHLNVATLDPANLRTSAQLIAAMQIGNYTTSVDYEDYLANQYGAEQTSISGNSKVYYRAAWADSLSGHPAASASGNNPAVTATTGLLAQNGLAGSYYIPTLGTYGPTGKTDVTQVKILGSYDRYVVGAVLSDLVTYIPSTTSKTPFFITGSATSALKNQNIPLTYYPPGTNIPDGATGSGDSGTDPTQPLIDDESTLASDQASYSVGEYTDGGSYISESYDTTGQVSGRITEYLYTGTTGDLIGGNDVFQIGNVKIAFNMAQVLSIDTDATGNTTITLNGQNAGSTETLYIPMNGAATFTDSAGSLTINSEALAYASSLAGYTGEQGDVTTNDSSTFNGGGFAYSSQVGYGVVNLATALEVQSAFNLNQNISSSDQVIAGSWYSENLANQDTLVLADAANSTGGGEGGNDGGTGIAAPVSEDNSGGSNPIDGTGGGTIYDVAGTNTINLGSADAAVYATLGQDTVIGGEGNATIIASGNTNNVDVQAGGGATVFTPGSGNNTVEGYSGFSMNESLTVDAGDSGGTLTVNSLFESVEVFQSQNTIIDAEYAPITVHADGLHTLTVNGSDGVDHWTYTGTAADTLTITEDQYQVDTISDASGVVATLGVDPTIIDGSAGGTINDVAGKDIINLGSIDATVVASVGQDTINLGSGNDTIDASANFNMVTLEENFMTGAQPSTLNVLGGAGYLGIDTGATGLSVIHAGTGGAFVEQSGATEFFAGGGFNFIVDNGSDLQIVGADGQEAVDIAPSNNEAGEYIDVYQDFASNATIVTDGMGGQWNLLGGEVSGSGNGSVISPPDGSNPGTGGNNPGSGGSNPPGSGGGNPPPPPTPTGSVYISGPQSETINAGSFTNISGFFILGNGADVTDQNLTMTVSDTDGTLFMSQALNASDADALENYLHGAGTPYPGSIITADSVGSGTSSVSITGDYQALEYALTNLSYAAANTAGTDSINVDITDSLGNTFTETTPITVQDNSGTNGTTPSAAGYSPPIDADIALPFGIYQQSSGFMVPVVGASSMGASGSMNISDSFSVDETQIRISSQNLISDTGTQFTLVSPDGTQAVLNESDALPDPNDLNTGDLILTTDAFRGETMEGNWTLYAQNTDGTSSGIVNSWGLGFSLAQGNYASDPTIYTDSFSALAATDPSRTNVNFDANSLINSGGQLDLLGLTAQSTVDMSGGSGVIDGVNVNINGSITALNAGGSTGTINIIANGSGGANEDKTICAGNGITNITDNTAQYLSVSSNGTGVINANFDNASGDLSVYSDAQVNLTVNSQTSGFIEVGGVGAGSGLNIDFDGMSATQIENILKNGISYDDAYSGNGALIRDVPADIYLGNGIIDISSAEVFNTAPVSFSATNTINGPGGSAQIYGDPTNHLNQNISTANGNAIVFGGSGTDSIATGDGNDSVIAGSGSATIAAGSGNNTIDLSAQTTSSVDTVNTVGTDMITAGLGITNLSASVGATLNATQNGGTMNFLEGSDLSASVVGTGTAHLSYASSGLTLMGGSGNDTLTALFGDMTLQGGSGDDTLVAGSGNNTFLGSGGDSTYLFDQGWGNTVIDGAGVHDTLSFGTGIAASDLTLTQNGTNLLISESGSSNTITVSNEYSGSAQLFASLKLSDGSTIAIPHSA